MKEALIENKACGELPLVTTSDTEPCTHPKGHSGPHTYQGTGAAIYLPSHLQRQLEGYSREATLEQKQAYYKYGVNAWEYKQPPVIDRLIHDRLTELGGRDEYGDPLYRFLWAGAAVERQHPEDNYPTVRGSRDACRMTPVLYTKEGLIIPSRLEPRYLFVRAMQLKAICYKGRKGQTIRVNRKEDVPKGKFSWTEFKYVSFGKLFWYLERKLSPAQLVEAGIYKEDDSNLPRQGDYISILRLQYEGDYIEPTEEWLDVVGQYIQEVETLSPNELMLKDIDARDKGREDRERAQDELEREEFSREAEKVIDDDVNRVYFH